MRLSFLYRTFLRRAMVPLAQRNDRTTVQPGKLGRALQDAQEWNVRNQARRKRLGLE
jgi:hypothetical protein